MRLKLAAHRVHTESGSLARCVASWLACLARARLLLVLLLAVSLSEAATTAVVLLGYGAPECQGACADELDFDSCPTCTAGPCAKLAAVAVADATPLSKVPVVALVGLLRAETSPRGPSSERLFRPPIG